jgi:multiple sugar transport system substrate-binding protein
MNIARASSNRGRGASRRVFVAGTLGTLGTGVLAAACGSIGGGDTIAKGITTRTVTLRWSTWGDSQNTFNSVGAPQGVRAFNMQFPNIKVEIEPQLSGWSEKNTAEWIAGTGPDISGHCCQFSAVFARQGLLWNMEPSMKRDVADSIRKDFPEWLMKFFWSPEAGQFALPMYSGTIALYYNRAAFQKKGVPFPDETWDWNKYREVATRLTTPGGGEYGRMLITNRDNVLQRLHQNGANWVDPKDDTRAAFDSPRALEALQYERDAGHKEKNAAVPGLPNVFPGTEGKNTYSALAEGIVAMLEGGSWLLIRMTQPQNIPEGTDWDVAPLPKGPVQRDTLATNDGWSIWKGGKAIEESWEFMKFLMGDEWNEINSRASGQQSGRKSFQERWVKLIKEANPKLASKNLKPFTDAIQQNYARPIELFRKHVEAVVHVQKAIDTAIQDGTAAVDASFKEAAQLVNQLHR